MQDFVDYFSLSPWDWFTSIITLTSLIVSFCAFIIAKKTYSVSKETLDSQIQTALNTTPPINVYIQRFLIKKFISSLFLTHIQMRAIWRVIKDNNYMYYLPNSILDNLLLSKDSIHRELYYENEVAFGKFNELYNEIDNYNSNIMAIKEFANLKANSSFFDAIFELEDQITRRIVYLYIIIMNDEFHCRIEETCSPIDDVLRQENIFIFNSPKFCAACKEGAAHNNDDYNSDDDNYEYFNTKDVFSLLAKGDLTEVGVIGYMNKHVKKSMKIYSKYLIKL